MVERVSDERLARLRANNPFGTFGAVIHELIDEIDALRSELAAARRVEDGEVADTIASLMSGHCKLNIGCNMMTECACGKMEDAADLLTRLSAAKAEAERKPKAVPPDQITAAVAMCRAWSEQNKDDFALSNAQSHIANMIERMGLLLGAAEKGRDHWSERAEYLHNALDDKHVALSESERRLATAREALTAETDLADKALEYACGLAAAGGGITTGLPAEEIARRLDNHTRQCNEVYDWSYPIRRARHAARDPNHPDNASLQPETKPE